MTSGICHALSSGGDGATDSDPPDLRTLLEVFPAELAGVLSGELEVERLGVVIVDEHETGPGIELLVGVEDQLVAARGWLGADVELRVGGRALVCSLVVSVIRARWCMSALIRCA
jgi:hypothetical protein